MPHKLHLVALGRAAVDVRAVESDHHIGLAKATIPLAQLLLDFGCVLVAQVDADRPTGLLALRRVLGLERTFLAAEAGQPVREHGPIRPRVRRVPAANHIYGVWEPGPSSTVLHGPTTV